MTDGQAHPDASNPEREPQRRSTFEPPAYNNTHDDDELANALAAALSQYTGAISIVPAETPDSPEMTDAPERASAPEHPVGTDDASTLPPSPAPSVTPAWESLPAPDPAQIVSVSEAIAQPPVRRSLPDNELIEAVTGPIDTLAAIERLEAQLELRAEEAHEFEAWETTMLTLGTPDAIASVEEVRETFTGVIPVVGAAPVEPASEPERSEELDTAPAAPPTPTAPPALIEPPTPDPVDVSRITTGPIGVVPPREADSTDLPVELSPFDSPAEPMPLTPAFTFDALMSGESETRDTNDPEASPFSLAMLPDPPAEPLPVTGTITVPPEPVAHELDDDIDDDIDDVDRVGGAPAAIAISGAATTDVYAASAATATLLPDADDPVLAEPERMSPFRFEESGLEPTPAAQRAGRASRQFWLWFAVHSSVVSLAAGAALLGFGLSLRQALVALVAGLALSAVPLGLTAVLGRRSSQPTMVVSRATFGIIGNIGPASLALVVRVFWGAALLWLLGQSVARVLSSTGIAGSLSVDQLALIATAGGLLIAGAAGFLGYAMIVRIQAVVTIVSTVLVLAVIVLTASTVDIDAALGLADGPWLAVLGGAVLVFSVVGAVWATSGGDLARYQRGSTGGASTALWAGLGAVIPALVLLGYGALLAASDPAIATGLASTPVETLTGLVPEWFAIPLVLAIGLGLLSAVVLSVYSAGFAVQSIGFRLQRQWAILLVAVLIAIVSGGLALGVTDGFVDVLRDAATTLAVPVAAWVGILVADTLIRSRSLDSADLLSRGGRYGDVRWVHTIALAVLSAVGFGLTSASVPWLAWQGYLFSALGVASDSVLASTDIGVLVALLLGIVVPLATGIPAVRRQETAGYSRGLAE